MGFGSLFSRKSRRKERHLARVHEAQRKEELQEQTRLFGLYKRRAPVSLRESLIGRGLGRSSIRGSQMSDLQAKIGHGERTLGMSWDEFSTLARLRKIQNQEAKLKGAIGVGLGLTGLLSGGGLLGATGLFGGAGLLGLGAKPPITPAPEGMYMGAGGSFLQGMLGGPLESGRLREGFAGRQTKPRSSMYQLLK